MNALEEAIILSVLDYSNFFKIQLPRLITRKKIPKLLLAPKYLKIFLLIENRIKNSKICLSNDDKFDGVNLIYA